MKRATNLKEKLKNTPKNLLKAKRFKENLPWFKDMGALKYNAEDLYDKVLEIQRKDFENRPECNYYYTMECTLADNQIINLLTIINTYVVLEPISKETLKNILCDTIEHPIKIKDIGVLGYLLMRLKELGYIVSDWQKIAEENKFFVSRKGVVISGKRISNMTSAKVGIVENIRIGRRGYKRGIPKYDKIIEPIEIIDKWLSSL